VSLSGHLFRLHCSGISGLSLYTTESQFVPGRASFVHSSLNSTIKPTWFSIEKSIQFTKVLMENWHLPLTTLRNGDPSIIQSALHSFSTRSYIVLNVEEPEITTVRDAFLAAEAYFTQNDFKTKKKDRINGKIGYKRNVPKERYQFRKCGSDYVMPSIEFKKTMFGVYFFFENVAQACMDLILDDLGISKEDLSEYLDPDPLPLDTYSTSVFNLYHYFNTGTLFEMSLILQIHLVSIVWNT
jgi:hypothetical protein